VSCGSRKSALTADTRINEQTDVQSAAANRIDSAAFSQVLISEQKNADTEDYEETVKIEFDTEKPLNNATNLPPVKSIEKTNKGKKTAKKAAKTTEQSNAVNYDEYTLKALNSHLNTATEAKITEKTEKKESQMFKWLAWIAIAAAVIFICTVVKKAMKGTGIINRIKNLFK
jgi:hypothetical protein